MWNIILFDLDGTLTDSKDGIINSVLNALNHFGIQAERENMLRFVGPPLHESFQEYYGFSQEQIDIGIEKFREYFNAKGWLENLPYPGIEDLLKDLKAAGKTLLVATSKPEQFAVRILEHFGLAQYFDHICGAPVNEQQGARKSRVIENALSYCSTPWQSDAVMVGDRRHDVTGAHEANLPVIGVLYGYGDREELEEAGADYIAADLTELKDLLLYDTRTAERWVQVFDPKGVLKPGWWFGCVFTAPDPVPHLEGDEARAAFNALEYDTAVIFREGTMGTVRPHIALPGITAKVSADWAEQTAFCQDTDLFITDREFRWTFAVNHEGWGPGPYFCRIDDLGGN
ncbi:MAG: HAD hydrolase-like protein [Oscillospiraceae bacterium]|nr:HAD hydrolase-like protein [Oscillospiraceae bacterium]